MKTMHVLAVSSAAVILLWTAGGCSTPPKPLATLKINSLESNKEIAATITADQKFIIDGRKFEVADIPQQLAKRKAEQDIIIIVYPESKMTRETLVELIKTLAQNNYSVTMAAHSKYADTPIPPHL